MGSSNPGLGDNFKIIFPGTHDGIIGIADIHCSCFSVTKHRIIDAYSDFWGGIDPDHNGRVLSITTN